METIEYLPLGSIVVIKETARKAMIVARGIQFERDGEKLFYDYGSVLYPEGLTGDELLYFNREAIGETLFSGYHDDEDTIVCDLIGTFVQTHPDLNRPKPKPSDLWT